jgi:S1-C subfamily serine protease
MKETLFLLLLSGCSVFTKPESVELPDTTFFDSLDATAMLVHEDGNSYCAGVFHRDYVLTANHCVSDKEEILVLGRNWTEPQGTWRVIHSNPDGDFAILSPNFSGHTPPHRAEISPQAPMIGDEIVTVGHPLGLGWTFSLGRVVGFRDGYIAPVFMQLTAMTTNGNSGGPVFNTYGEIIGIVSARAINTSTGQTEAFLTAAVPISVLREALGDQTEE